MTEEMTLERFKRCMKRRQMYHLICFILGVATVIIFSMDYATEQTQLNDLIKGLYTGMGGGIGVASIFLFIRNYRIIKNEKELKQKKIVDTDERNIRIQGKAKEITYQLLFIALYIGVVVTGIFNPFTSMVLCGYILVFGFLNAILIRIFQRKM